MLEKFHVHFYIFSSFEILEAYNFDTIGMSIEHISVLGNLCFINLGVHYVEATTTIYYQCFKYYSRSVS